jgi:hypothetical protein
MVSTYGKDAYPHLAQIAIDILSIPAISDTPDACLVD